jgi:oxygen-independent coproporphyrinogen-3 oxidase
MMSSFGAYVHIPFCIQRCHYCDFATYSQDQIEPNDEYISAVCREITLRQKLFVKRPLDTLYFGGGTPSLLSTQQIGRIIEQFNAVGFTTHSSEITVEVNPATLTPEKCQDYRTLGVNRVSLGCQSFHDPFLQACHREHTAQQTRDTIALVKEYFENYSLDLLFALPQQNQDHLAKDLEEIVQVHPPHVSAYCLTVPEHHPMNQGRASETAQVAMFRQVIRALSAAGLSRYELSNFCRPSYQSRHNNLYWTDQSYWGVGLGAHSYRSQPGFGFRFWNSRSYKTYLNQMHHLTMTDSVAAPFSHDQWENLQKHEALSDFCHTHLRMTEGFRLQQVRQKFGGEACQLIQKRLQPAIKSGLVAHHKNRFHLTEEGFLLSNQVFSDLLISAEDIDKLRPGPII